jgi:hypothetical protein
MNNKHEHERSRLGGFVKEGRKNQYNQFMENQYKGIKTTVIAKEKT